MKAFIFFLTMTLFLATYLWAYDNFLYDRMYVQYLPKAPEGVPFREYDGKTGEVTNLDQNPMSENLLDYLPWYAGIMYRVASFSVIGVPIMVLSGPFIGLFLFIRKKIFRDWKLILFELSIWLLSASFYLHTELID